MRATKFLEAKLKHQLSLDADATKQIAQLADASDAVTARIFLEVNIF
jgi:hypothetical protein